MNRIDRVTDANGRSFTRVYESDDVVKEIIDHRYGGIDKLPLDEPAVAPGDLATSPLLIEVPKLDKKH